jgi:hypothetical protein
LHDDIGLLDFFIILGFPCLDSLWCLLGALGLKGKATGYQPYA